MTKNMLEKGLETTRHIWPFNLLREINIQPTDFSGELPHDFYASLMYEIYELGDREAYIILQWFEQGKPQKEIANDLNISDSRVAQIRNKSLRILRKRHTKLINGLNKYVNDTVKVEIKLMMKNNVITNDIYSDEFTNMKISKLNMSSRAYGFLYKREIRTIKDILDSEYTFFSGKYISTTAQYTVDEIIDKMRSIGYTDFGIKKII